MYSPYRILCTLYDFILTGKFRELVFFKSLCCCFFNVCSTVDITFSAATPNILDVFLELSAVRANKSERREQSLTMHCNSKMHHQTSAPRFDGHTEAYHAKGSQRVASSAVVSDGERATYRDFTHVKSKIICPRFKQ